jgi:ribose transport system substrate-binding protein
VQKSKGRIAFAFPYTTVPVYQPLIAAGRAEAKKRGYELLQSSSGTSASAQLAEVDTWIAGGVKAIILFALNPQTMGPVIAKARAAHVKIIAYAEPLTGANGSIVFNNTQGAHLLGKALGHWVASHGGKAQLALLEADASGRQDYIRVHTAAKIAEGVASGISVVAGEQANTSAASYTVALPMLEAHPGISAVLAVTDDDILGWTRALTTLHRAADSTYWVSYDCSLPVLQEMKAGTLKGVDACLNVPLIGKDMVDAAANAIVKSGPTVMAPGYTAAVTGDVAGINYAIKYDK